MTPQERQLVDELFDRLANLESAQRDPDAADSISQGLRRAPNGAYALVQTVLLQDEALKRAHARIVELEGHAPDANQSGGFLDTMRDTLFGQTQPRGSVPPVRPPETVNRPAWNTGQVLPQARQYDRGQYDQGQPNQGGYNQPYGAQQTPMGGAGGSFLGTAAAAAAGMVGGSLLLGSIRSMMGGSHQSFGDSSSLGGERGGNHAPWSDQSSSDLARDAGVNDIGSSGHHADDSSRAGFFDSASNDHDNDAMDLDAEDFGGGSDGDSDFA